MCDFHSCCVRVDGALAHVPENSHSKAAQEAGWMENEPHKRPRFVETEWDGRGKYPGAERIARVPAVNAIYGGTVNEIRGGTVNEIREYFNGLLGKISAAATIVKDNRPKK